MNVRIGVVRGERGMFWLSILWWREMWRLEYYLSAGDERVRTGLLVADAFNVRARVVS